MAAARRPVIDPALTMLRAEEGGVGGGWGGGGWTSGLSHETLVSAVRGPYKLYTSLLPTEPRTVILFMWKNAKETGVNIIDLVLVFHGSLRFSTMVCEKFS